MILLSFQSFYKNLRLAGKPAKVALTQVSKKLIIIPNSALKNPKIALAK